MFDFELDHSNGETKAKLVVEGMTYGVIFYNDSVMLGCCPQSPHPEGMRIDIHYFERTHPHAHLPPAPRP